MPRHRPGGYPSKSSMAGFVTKDQRLNPRFGTHAIVLIAVIGVTLASAFTRSGASEQTVARVAANSSESDQAAPAQRALELDTRAAAPAAAPVTQAADQRQSLAFNPRQGLPQWLHAIKDAPLWTGADA